MDHNVGLILDCLKEEKLDQDTVVIYVSDNGRKPGRTKDQPLRGGKISTFEGGLKVPCIVWGPGLGIKAQTSSEITFAMDFLPTLATLANIKVPGGNAMFSTKIQAAVPMGAQTSFHSPRIIELSERKTGAMFYSKLLGGSYSTHKKMYTMASPITYVDKDTPPILFISGENDNDDTKAIKFRNKMTELGLISNYRMIYDAPHGFPQKQAWLDEAFRTSLNFLKIHLELM